MTVDEWNRLYRIGTAVKWKNFRGHEVRCKTTGPAATWDDGEKYLPTEKGNESMHGISPVAASIPHAAEMLAEVSGAISAEMGKPHPQYCECFLCAVLAMVQDAGKMLEGWRKEKEAKT